MTRIWGAAGSDRGLTLLEVLVALGIMAMAMAMVLPFGSSSGSAVDSDSTARAIAAGLRGARAAAIAANRPVDFIVDTEKGAFGYERFSSPKRGGLRLALFTTADMRAGDAVGSIRFFPDGSSTGGGVAVNAGTRRLVVMVDWLSGGVSLVRDPARSAG